MEEVVDADHVFVMDHGHVVMQGTPREIFFTGGYVKALQTGCAAGDDSC